MSYMHERVAYLKGLAEGMELDRSTKESKLLLEIIDVLDNFAEEMDEVYDELDDITEAIEEIDEYMDAIDEDLSDVEDILEDFQEMESLDESYETMPCPECGAEIAVEDQILDSQDEIECPSCGVIIDFSDDCECCEDHEGSCCDDECCCSDK